MWIIVYPILLLSGVVLLIIGFFQKNKILKIIGAITMVLLVALIFGLGVALNGM